MKRTVSVFRRSPMLTLALWVAACGGDQTGPLESLPRALTAAERSLIASSTGFSFALFRELLSGADADANVLVSPLSVAMALGMALNGAAGETEEAMRATLGLDGLAGEDINRSFRDLSTLLESLDGRVEFGIANSIWVREGEPFQPDFLDANRRYFEARVEVLDFAAPNAAGTINAWVNEQTRGRIPRIVPDVLPATLVMYVINAMYFEGDWTQPFDGTRTAGASFRLARGDTAVVPMMTHGGPIRVGSGYRDGAQVLELPYARGAFSMVVIAPDDPLAVETVVTNLTRATWDEWLGSLEETEATVFLPKFSLSLEVVLNDALEALGMGLALSDEADFTRARDGGGLSISEVKHSAFVVVDEEGTQAAAATAVSFFESGPLTIRIDRPFVFVLRERLSGTVLFIGRVMDPR